jgi:hypothetical protein
MITSIFLNKRYDAHILHNVFEVFIQTEYFQNDTSHNQYQEAVLADRKGRQLRACGVTERTVGGRSPRFLMVNRKYNMLYCGIPKVGLTFWFRMLQVLGNSHYKSPYDIKPQDANKVNVEYVKNHSLALGHLTNYLKFTFVRNPYSRLVSAYIDKLFSPNPYYWTRIGKEAIARFRRDPSAHALSCGHDVTFAEFIQYVIHTGETHTGQDEHFIPAHELCKPCQIRYDVIGKMETFVNDTLYILNKLNLSTHAHNLANITEMSTRDAMYDGTQSAFGWKRSITKCMTPMESLRRVWIKMQTRGFISPSHNFPLSPTEAMVITESQFLEILHKARRLSPYSDSDTHIDKRQLLIDLFSTVPMNNLHKLRKLYDQDFDVFNYDSEPYDMFTRKSNVISNQEDILLFSSLKH